MTELTIFDRTGFPMVWIAELNAHMHLLPVTKIQFEYFICDEPRSRFDQAWYNEICNLNPRITPRAIRGDNYWQTFITAVTPDEVERFAQWSGEKYAIPTREEWHQAYMAVKDIVATSMEQITARPEARERTKLVLQKLDTETAKIADQTGSRTQADQMLMRGGIFEWVYDNNHTPPWVGMGKPHSSFIGGFYNLERGGPTYTPRNPETDRLYPIGFRLIKRM